MKLTEKSIARLAAPSASGKQELFWDTTTKGFGVLCSAVSRKKSFIVQRPLQNGNRRRVTIGPTNVLSLAAAREKADLVLAQFYSGIDPKAGRKGNLSLKQALDAYLAARNNLRPKSIAGYRSAVENYLSPWVNLPLSQITGEMVEQRHARIAAEVKEAGRGSGAATANSVMRAFRAVYNFAAERDPSLKASPTKLLRRSWFKVPRRTRLVKADDLPAFYSAVNDLPNPVARDFILLMLFTGLRKTEAATLKWSDVDFKAKLIRIPAVRTKSGSKLDLPMCDFLHNLLVARRAVGDSAFVFPSNSTAGRIMDAKFPLKIVAEKTGIEVSAHDLRRTFCTIAESCDVSPLALKSLINHSIGQDVTSGYIQMTVERLRTPAQKIAERMKELCGIQDAAAANVARMNRSVG